MAKVKQKWLGFGRLPQMPKWLLIFLVMVCVGVGVFLIYSSFAGSGYIVYHDNVDYWRERIRQCESGGRYTAANNSGHYGAYQYDVATWRSNVSAATFALYPRADLAPPDVQDQAFNDTFAKRGTQPWVASQHCWDKNNALRITAQPRSRGSFNSIVSGVVTYDGKALPGVTIQTCFKDVPSLKTDQDGIFSFDIPVGTSFCIRTADGVPPGAKLTQINNNPEHTGSNSYENQVAGVSRYRSFIYFFTPQYSWDRDYDTGFDFAFSSK